MNRKECKYNTYSKNWQILIFYIISMEVCMFFFFFFSNCLYHSLVPDAIQNRQFCSRKKQLTLQYICAFRVLSEATKPQYTHFSRLHFEARNFFQVHSQALRLLLSLPTLRSMQRLSDDHTLCRTLLLEIKHRLR